MQDSSPYMINLKDVLSIPSVSKREDRVIEFILDFCRKNDLYHYLDEKRNIYVQKGSLNEDEYFPCVISHMDTVHSDQDYLVDKNINLNIFELYNEFSDYKPILVAYDPITKLKTGIGGDNKCGVYVCLKLLEELDNIKIAFFVEEEIGMLGSSSLDPKFFENVGYALQPDAPTNNWFSRTCSGHRLWTEEFFSIVGGILEKYNIDNISRDPFTDVVQLRKNFDFCCAVLPVGYYNQHCADEYVVESDTKLCVELAKDIISDLGNRKFYMERSSN